jgi:hypothetical protein
MEKLWGTIVLLEKNTISHCRSKGKINKVPIIGQWRFEKGTCYLGVNPSGTKCSADIIYIIDGKALREFANTHIAL